MVKFRKNLIFAYSAIPLFRYSVFRILLTPFVICSLNSNALMKSLLMQSIVLISLLFILLACSMNSVYFT